MREALIEREVLLRMAPHLIRPMRFMLPPTPGLRAPLHAAHRPVPLRLARRAASCCRPSRTVDLTHHAVGQPLKRSFRYGFEYSDCWVDDARLVVLNALDARRARRRHPHPHQADAHRAPRDDWELVLNNRGRREVATARVLVNAAGPWIGEVADTILRTPLPKPVRLVKGSHIVVRRRFEHDTRLHLAGR